MKRTTYWLSSIMTLVVATFLAIQLPHRQKTETPALTPLNAEQNVDLSPQRAEMQPNAPSLRNDAPPEFDPAKIDPKFHRDFQLAKGEQHIVARPGDLLHLHLCGTLEKGWHTFPPQTSNVEFLPVNKIKLDAQSAAKIEGDITATPPPIVDPISTEVYGDKVLYHTTDFVYDIPLRVAANTALGRSDLSLSIYNRVFNGERCLPFTTMSFPMTLIIAGDARTPVK